MPLHFLPLGLVERRKDLEEDFEDSLLDTALIGAAQRVEHYEIVAYGTVRSFAQTLGESEHASLLNETLEEEKETDEKLTELAPQMNSDANQAGEEQMGEQHKAEQQQEDRKKPRRVA